MSLVTVFEALNAGHVVGNYRCMYRLNPDNPRELQWKVDFSHRWLFAATLTVCYPFKKLVSPSVVWNMTLPVGCVPDSLLANDVSCITRCATEHYVAYRVTKPAVWEDI
jgi:hypothetical protein